MQLQHLPPAAPLRSRHPGDSGRTGPVSSGRYVGTSRCRCVPDLPWQTGATCVGWRLVRSHQTAEAPRKFTHVTLEGSLPYEAQPLKLPLQACLLEKNIITDTSHLQGQVSAAPHPQRPSPCRQHRSCEGSECFRVRLAKSICARTIANQPQLRSR